jgi:hypothetical protein
VACDGLATCPSQCADAIPVGRREAGVAIEISDDGVGGATGRVDPACGLTDRVEALHGLCSSRARRGGHRRHRRASLCGR